MKFFFLSSCHTADLDQIRGTISSYVAILEPDHLSSSAIFQFENKNCMFEDLLSLLGDLEILTNTCYVFMQTKQEQKTTRRIVRQYIQHTNQNHSMK